MKGQPVANSKSHFNNDDNIARLIPKKNQAYGKVCKLMLFFLSMQYTVFLPTLYHMDNSIENMQKIGYTVAKRLFQGNMACKGVMRMSDI